MKAVSFLGTAFFLVYLRNFYTMDVDIISNNFRKFVPPETAPILASWVIKYKVNVKVKPRRKTKLGDFRPAMGTSPPQITINADLPPYSFLLTFLHEFAHLLVWEKHKNNVDPHGEEWKITFKEVTKQFIEKDVFPSDIKKALIKHFKNTKSSSCYDVELMRILESYHKKEILYVENIPNNTAFQLENDKRWFRKIRLLRKRFLCEELNTKKQYRVPVLAKVQHIKTISG